MEKEKQYGNLEICIVSENQEKINEIQEVLNNFKIKLKKCNAKKIEIQNDDIKQIAIYAAINAYNEIKIPLIVDDSALYIKSLLNFPGPYTSYVYKTIGIKGILKLMEGIKDRDATFKTSLVYVYEKGFKVFEGIIEGVISENPRGYNGFGFDPIFIPYNANKTFAEMDIQEKNKYSHRAKAALAFGNWIINS
ncbi:XTP/dITP diphosphatase [Caldisphaera sp.]|uniref:XTP/dITP diphosphatase n=1 Tax=Caldisphaera sp. TaxID=2060322 RepID=UPI003D0C9226